MPGAAPCSAKPGCPAAEQPAQLEESRELWEDRSMLLALRPLLSARRPWVPWKKDSAHEVPAIHPHAPKLPSHLLQPLQASMALLSHTVGPTFAPTLGLSFVGKRHLQIWSSDLRRGATSSGALSTAPGAH